jgi:hypothetical protein
MLWSSGGAGSPPPLGQALLYAVLACPVMQPTSRVTRATSFGSGTVRAPGLSRAASLSVSPYVAAHAISRRSSTHSLRSTANGHESSSCPERTRSTHLRSSGLQHLRELDRRRWRAGASLSARGAFVLSRHAACCRHASLRSFRARHADLGWANLAEGRLHLDRLSATAAFRFFPLLRRPRRAREPSDGIPRGRQKSVRPAVLRCAPAHRQEPRVRSDRPRPVGRHRGRDRRGPTRNRRPKWRPSAASRSPRTATMPAQ